MASGATESGQHSSANNKHAKKRFVGYPIFLDIKDKILLKHGPEVEHPTRMEQMLKAIQCPPHGRVAYNITKIAAVVFTWLTVITLLKKQALPGSNFWGLCIVIMGAMVGGEIVKKLRLPELLGMLVAGFMLQNIPGISVAAQISPGWSSALRSIALVMILIRAGLGMDVIVLRRLSRSIAMLAFLPATIESIVGAVAIRYLLGFEWLWSFVLGFLLCGVSPAVLVPNMILLHEIGLGVEKGLPILLMAAASIENVYVIVVMSVLISAGFSAEGIGMQIALAPIQIAIGLTYGMLFGVLFWYFPHEAHPRKADYRFIILLTAGITAVFGGNAFGYAGAGPLACLVMAFMAGIHWGKADPVSLKIVSGKFGILWRYFQPVLFGLIGAAVSISKIQADTIGLSIAVICIGSTVRFLVTLFTVSFAGFNWKERLFAAIAWIPKATVQAALGSSVYDYTVFALATIAAGSGHGGTAAVDSTYMLSVQKTGIQILTTAVLCIVITAPIGALGITLTQNRLLERASAPVTANSIERELESQFTAELPRQESRVTLKFGRVDATTQTLSETATDAKTE
ncbi:sodium/hydrogen exchanger 9B2-like [Paramacrobiotus metropolitanus]|uniref:sodium/hydrogen exchanger 9B2-like n=1 Tax=Paramacrobiotus metropolitanus TaxID=2943436 RepID=UPI002445DAF1|nr:sodium/hydrogen exchanger 9B2-like [Paramacrobiotus metropolitanus]XP_055338294.1 sodium/hydrogen exchanger 9B2-like [Paramacrobiotus metropolitanus]XP_055338295.1 sodium/hydrogen exchanger 9B2-like [Paramacrobiotus metropolitanus]XP_055338296.1 sodium/hydrogen exchanger 9B2-like [Paramacrobiotus metropolitanus]XP_055338297.1 sodium/hydrogen exchanger 9B2-like [Paramacrobiotus metropolitanus]